MANRKTHTHQEYDGAAITEVVEDEPLEAYHRRELSERLKNVIAAAKGEMDTLDTRLTQVSQVDDWSTLQTALDDIFKRQKKIIRGIHALAKMELRQLEDLEI